MGQQQLLLLVLGVVIVGLAVVVGIQAFGENQKSANQDALVNDAIRIASDLQAQALKPTQFGGAGAWADVDVTAGTGNASFQAMGYEATDGTYTNLNGSFTLGAGTAANGGANPIAITGTSTDADGNPLNEIVVTVEGATSEDISTTVNAVGAADGTADGT